MEDCSCPKEGKTQLTNLKSTRRFSNEIISFLLISLPVSRAIHTVYNLRQHKLTCLVCTYTLEFWSSNRARRTPFWKVIQGFIRQTHNKLGYGNQNRNLPLQDTWLKISFHQKERPILDNKIWFHKRPQRRIHVRLYENRELVQNTCRCK